MDKPREFMIDTETLALSPRAAVWEVAMVEILPSGLAGEPTRWNTAPDFLHKHKSEFDVVDATVEWSLKQPGTNFKAWYEGFLNSRAPETIFVNHPRTIIAQMLEKAGGLGSAQHTIWWAKNAAFDFPILEHLSYVLRMSSPWHYRNKGCLYTLRIEAERRWGVERVKECAPAYTGVSHGAEDDCLNQVRQLAYYRSIIDNAAVAP